jgi:hypothetical protein
VPVEQVTRMVYSGMLKDVNGLILPHIKKRLKEESFNLEMDVTSYSPHVAEVCVKGSVGYEY